MTSASSAQLRRLPLHERHAQRGAKFGHFGDWEVPLYYTSILEEHEAVRHRAGLFDISHMGEFFVTGKGAEDFLNEILPRDIPSMPDGKALYMPLLNEQGGIVDDIIVYRLAQDRFLLIVNAGNVEKDFRWLESCKNRLRGTSKSSYELTNQSEEKGLLALQGPLSLKILNRSFDASFSDLGYYYCREWENKLIARTGYTGEDGFEIMANQKDLPGIWDTLFQNGEDLGLVPVGFGSRDTLRLEAAMLLYGHDMEEDITPLEAGIAWALDLEKPSFIGKEKLLRLQKEGVKRKLAGFEMLERGIPRQGFSIKKGEQLIGLVTSGSFAPTLQKNIGLGYLASDEAVPGNEIDILIRDKAVKAKVVKLPFYKRKK